MQMNIFPKTSNLKQYQDLVNQINILTQKFKSFTDSELKAKSLELRKGYQETLNLTVYLPESFALTREVSDRILGLRHFDVQLIGGLVLDNQQIAEMRTGEGKTLVATLPACLNALTNQGVHIVTVNDYLANRDQVSMGQVYKFLGFKTGLIQTGMSMRDRQKNYNTDITYVTNSELAFDFLRDNMALNVKDLVLRPFNYCIIDEVDSILIDEAQTPLIISNSVDTAVDKDLIATELVAYLERNVHYQIDEKNRNVFLTDLGSRQIENILKIKDLYNPKDPWIPHILNAIKAHVLFQREVDYIIQNNRIIIVDEFTGRLMPDRRWGEGLHQAVEAKEELPIRQKTETVATITYQNFFLLYPKLSGMTGTGKTAEIEFEKIYNLSVEVIPSARTNRRIDLPDLIYKDQFSKWSAIGETCNQIAESGQPILIGTTTVEKSEMLGELLNEYKLSYQILNAKPENVRRESEIVAQAGRKTAITIATNMAGRGTDIMLGGNTNFLIEKELYDLLSLTKNYLLFKKSDLFNLPIKILLNRSSQKCISVLSSLLNTQEFLTLSDIDILRILRKSKDSSKSQKAYEFAIHHLVKYFKIHYEKQQKQKTRVVQNLGGLYIVGTERNDSRRVDNQLRGRCGRQGDPGISRFFLSLDDNLLRLFGGANIQNFMQTQMLDTSPLESNLLTKSLESAQRRVEERAYQQRKNLFDYDEILNQQRKIIYNERKFILRLKNTFVEKNILGYGEQLITDIFLEWQKKNKDTNQLLQLVDELFPQDLSIKYLDSTNIETSLFDYKRYLVTTFWLTYQIKKLELAIYQTTLNTSLDRSIILINIDRVWREHLQNMSLLREAVGWRGYGQRNPLYEYKREAIDLFERREEILRNLVIHDLFRSFIL